MNHPPHGRTERYKPRHLLMHKKFLGLFLRLLKAPDPSRTISVEGWSIVFFDGSSSRRLRWSPRTIRTLECYGWEECLESADWSWAGDPLPTQGLFFAFISTHRESTTTCELFPIYFRPVHHLLFTARKFDLHVSKIVVLWSFYLNLCY